MPTSSSRGRKKTEGSKTSLSLKTSPKSVPRTVTSPHVDDPVYFELPKSSKSLRTDFPTVYQFQQDRNAAVQAGQAKEYDAETKRMSEKKLMTHKGMTEAQYQFLTTSSTVQGFAAAAKDDDYLLQWWQSESKLFRDSGSQVLPVGDAKEDSWIQKQTFESDFQPTDY